nr:immunoglobulin light chain junction region [Macaca mulatta]MOW42219.1 immunoglobulin light chain junction region [Macaca mulatta]
CGQGTHLLSF